MYWTGIGTGSVLASGMFDEDYETQGTCQGWIEPLDENGYGLPEVPCGYEGDAIGTVRGTEFTWQCPECGNDNTEELGGW